MNCPVCGHKHKKFDAKSVSFKCENCQALVNSKTEELDYTHGGGQDVPNPEKILLRRRNAGKRLEILKTLLSEKHQNFIDIDCGSGEMLSESKSLFKRSIGFDTNQELIEENKKAQNRVINEKFKYDLLPEEFGQDLKVISLCHVLEHIDQAKDFFSSLSSGMKDGDLLLIEVPLYTGVSFQKESYDWKLWYPEHLCLYSKETLEFLGKQSNLKIKKYLTRNFYGDSLSRKNNLKRFVTDPLKFAKAAMTKESGQTVTDNYMQDYGFIVYEK